MSRRCFPRFSSLFALVVFTSAVLTTGCKKDDDGTGPDLTKPVIAVTTPSNFEATATAGQSLQLVFTVTDDRSLSQIRIEGHSAFDGHGHDKTASATPWGVDTIITATGTSFNVNLSLPIPDSAASGPYHVVVTALDASGNQAEFVEIELIITSPSAPTVTNLRLNDSLPAAGYTVHLLVGQDSLPQAVTAQIGDNTALDTIDVRIFVKGPDEDHPGAEVYHTVIGNLVGATNYSLNTSYPFRRADLLNDTDYVLTIKVKDLEGNYTIVQQELHVVLD